jgi:hypothetical protein
MGPTPRTPETSQFLWRLRDLFRFLCLRLHGACLVLLSPSSLEGAWYELKEGERFLQAMDQIEMECRE